MKKVSLKLGRYQNKFVSLHHNLLVFINHLNEKKIMAYVIGDDCIACGTCIDECPAGAISEGDKYLNYVVKNEWASVEGAHFMFRALN